MKPPVTKKRDYVYGITERERREWREYINARGGKGSHEANYKLRISRSRSS